MISEKLLSEVLCRKVIPNHEWESSLEYSFMINDIKHSQSINIYELAHKCKEWARLKGRSLRSNPSWDDCKKYECDDRDYDDMPMFIEDTEPEAIFKACQWILENKEMKC